MALNNPFDLSPSPEAATLDWGKALLANNSDAMVSSFLSLNDTRRNFIKMLFKEVAQRRLSPLSLYEPMERQLAFHKCQSIERLCLGSNRSGKTSVAVFEVAMAVTGQHPYIKYPKEGGRCVCVAKDGMAIGEVMYRKLFKRGTIRIVFDKKLMRYRAWQPWIDGYDMKKTKPSFPLIPSRMIKKIAWEDKGVDCPRKITLFNDWELVFYTSNGKPPQGIDVDLVWMTEEITREEWYDEMSARVIDRSGRFIWDATPQAATDKLWELHERAIDEEGRARPLISEFLYLIDDNPYLSPQDKQDFKDKHANNHDQYQTRILGKFVIQSKRVYPDFSYTFHGCDHFTIPDHWTRFIVVDPGFARLCALFVAVPPPNEDNHIYIYDEMYLERADAKTFARKLKEQMGPYTFESFLIDAHGSRRTESNGKNLRQIYSEEMAALNIRSLQTKSDFLPIGGDPGHAYTDSINDSVDQVRTWLWDRGEGRGPKLKFFREQCPTYKADMTKYKYSKTAASSGRLKPDRRKHAEGPDCFDEETQVLSELGWLPVADMTDFIKLATVNLATDNIEYQLPTGVIHRRHTGEMVRIAGQSSDILVTPNHRMVVYRRTDGKPEFKLARKLKDGDRIKTTAKWTGKDFQTVVIPRQFNSMGPDRIVDAADFAEFIGWFVSEGSTVKTTKRPGRGYCVTISQKFGEKHDRISSLLNRLPWKWNVRKKCGMFYCSSMALWKMLRPLGNKYTKYVPDWIKEASPRIIARFIESAVLGDGWIHKGARYYCTVSRKLADDMQELLTKIEKGSSICVRPLARMRSSKRSDGTIITPKKDQFHIREKTRVACSIVLNHKRVRTNTHFVPFDGMVHCATVNNGTLVLRRNGKVFIAGNCTRYLVLYDPQWCEPKKHKLESPAYRRFMAKNKNKRKNSFINLGPGSTTSVN